MDPRTNRRLVVVARVLATLALVPFIINKIVMNDMWSDRFASWGYPRWGAMAVTLVEIAAVLGLWVPSATWPSIAVLAVVLIGASGTWIANGPMATATIPLIVFAFVALLGFAERKSRDVPA